MRCNLHKKFERVSLTEEMIMNYKGLPEYMETQGWRRYRIEYGFECSCPEETIYLPPYLDTSWFEKHLNSLMQYEIFETKAVLDELEKEKKLHSSYQYDEVNAAYDEGFK